MSRAFISFCVQLFTKKQLLNSFHMLWFFALLFQFGLERRQTNMSPSHVEKSRAAVYLFAIFPPVATITPTQIQEGGALF